jgi:hypothetical protein
MTTLEQLERNGRNQRQQKETSRRLRDSTRQRINTVLAKQGQRLVINRGQDRRTYGEVSVYPTVPGPVIHNMTLEWLAKSLGVTVYQELPTRRIRAMTAAARIESEALWKERRS